MFRNCKITDTSCNDWDLIVYMDIPNKPQKYKKLMKLYLVKRSTRYHLLNYDAIEGEERGEKQWRHAGAILEA
jgi:hypothetical protein